MSSTVTSIDDHKSEKVDLQALVAQDKKERGERCLEIVNEALREHNCVVQLFVIIGDQKVPIGAIIGARVEIEITAN